MAIVENVGNHEITAQTEVITGRSAVSTRIGLPKDAFTTALSETRQKSSDYCMPWHFRDTSEIASHFRPEQLVVAADIPEARHTHGSIEGSAHRRPRCLRTSLTTVSGSRAGASARLWFEAGA